MFDGERTFTMNGSGSPYSSLCIPPSEKSYAVSMMSKASSPRSNTSLGGRCRDGAGPARPPGALAGLCCGTAGSAAAADFCAASVTGAGGLGVPAGWACQDETDAAGATSLATETAGAASTEVSVTAAAAAAVLSSNMSGETASLAEARPVVELGWLVSPLVPLVPLAPLASVAAESAESTEAGFRGESWGRGAATASTPRQSVSRMPISSASEASDLPREWASTAPTHRSERSRNRNEAKV